MIEILTLAAIFFLSYFNGANDNFKGVATLYGGGILNYWQSLTWASIATAVGCLIAFLWVEGLAKTFTGKGIIGPELIDFPFFPLAIACAVIGTLFLATFLGFPISTTHALLGALVGIASTQGISKAAYSNIGTIAAPLILSPLIAAGIAFLGWKLFGHKFKKSKDPQACLCIDDQPSTSLSSANNIAMSSMNVENLSIEGAGVSLVLNSFAECKTKNYREILSLPLRDILHMGSSFAVCAARGMNDAPKIAGLLLLCSPSGITPKSFLFLSTGMILGGVFHSKKVAERMSNKISTMNKHNSVWSNVVTSILVIWASKWGVPVSTTHTSVGAIAGTGSSSKSLQWGELSKVLSSWFLTLPCAFIFAYVFMILAKQL